MLAWKNRLLCGAYLAGVGFWGQRLSAQTPAADPFLAWLDGIAQRQLERREREVAEVRSAADADRRKASVRAKLARILGGFPTYSGPLHARVTGQIRNEFFTIEKVIFESLPGFYVTGNLYRPNSAGRYPAVLVPSGHTQEGKPEPQVLAANLARKGFVALTYDPIGQGEREQTYLPQLGRPLSGGGGNEHLELGARSILIGQSVARYFIFDAKRAVDYLISRADVDADRIGVTGCSGGGAIATYVGAFDPRIKAAAAGCFINTFRTLYTGPTPDSEMTLPAFLVNGLDLADLFELPAPLPWLLMATTEDYFVPAGARPVYEEARRWYGLYGAEEKIRFFVGPGSHGTPRESREEIYRWMIRWLKDGKGDAGDLPVPLYTNRELQVTASGHVDDEPGSRKLWQVILEEFRAKRDRRTVAALLAELRRLGVPSEGPAPAVRVGERIDGRGFRVETIRFAGEPGVEIGGKLYVPDGQGRKPAVVMIEEKRLPVPLFVQRSPSTIPLAEAMAQAGWVVLELEPRDSPAAYEGRPFLGNWVTNERVDLIGRNLAAMRAHDVLVAVDVLAARPDVDAGTIRGYARGAKGFWMLMAAAVDKRIGAVWLERTPWSFGAALEAPLASFLFDVLIPGFALHWDFNDLREAMGERRILWTDPANWMNQVVSVGPQYRYRYVGEKDDVYLDEFLKR
ncbi:MAG: acetylxylan esterase [Bryobacteraceae bacterium]